eukprot:720042_1
MGFEISCNANSLEESQRIIYIAYYWRKTSIEKFNTMQQANEFWRKLHWTYPSIMMTYNPYQNTWKLLQQYTYSNGLKKSHKRKIRRLKQMLFEQETQDDEKTEPKYAIMKKTQRTYTESSKNTSIPVGAIAKAVVNTIASFATSGALSPALILQIKDTVQNASWSKTTTNSKIIEHFFVEDTYVFLEIHRRVNKKKISLGVKRNKIHIKAVTKFFYVEASNKAARLILETMARREAMDAFEYINNNKEFKWC